MRIFWMSRFALILITEGDTAIWYQQKALFRKFPNWMMSPCWLLLGKISGRQFRYCVQLASSYLRFLMDLRLIQIPSIATGMPAMPIRLMQLFIIRGWRLHPGLKWISHRVQPLLVHTVLTIVRVGCGKPRQIWLFREELFPNSR